MIVPEPNHREGNVCQGDERGWASSGACSTVDSPNAEFSLVPAMGHGGVRAGALSGAGLERFWTGGAMRHRVLVAVFALILLALSAPELAQASHDMGPTRVYFPEPGH